MTGSVCVFNNIRAAFILYSLMPQIQFCIYGLKTYCFCYYFFVNIQLSKQDSVIQTQTTLRGNGTNRESWLDGVSVLTGVSSSELLSSSEPSERISSTIERRVPECVS